MAMLVDILAVGKLKDRALQMRCDEYMTWLGAYGKIHLETVPDSDPNREGSVLLQRLAKERHAHVIALAEEGREYTSVDFAHHLDGIQSKVIFIIGGPCGLSPEVKRQSNELWSLSRLTFTHEMARFLLLEQLFRAQNILHGGHYHRE